MHGHQSSGMSMNGPESDSAPHRSTTEPSSTAWPHHQLIRPVLEHARQLRWLEKPVRDTLLLDDMEQERNWTASSTVELSYTTERAKAGTRSLRLRTTVYNADHIAASRLPNGSFSGMGSYAAVDVNIPPHSGAIRLTLDPPQDWTGFNRISLWCYVHPTQQPLHQLNVQFLCNNAPAGPTEPMAMHFVHDLQPDAWNHIVWEIPEFRRDQVSAVIISQPMIGLAYPDGDASITYDIDQLQLEVVDVDHYEGWNVAPGCLAYHHVGYLPGAEKLALASDSTAASFEVVDATSGLLAATFPVLHVENQRGRFQILDFSALTTPGQYQLRCGQHATKTFAIADDLWSGVIEKLLNFFYADRCGFAIPEIHAACHLDLFGVHGDDVRSIGGGWHDAGNLCQGSYRTDLVVFALLRLYEQLAQRGLKPELQARVLEEVRLGLAWMRQSRFAPGWRITQASFNMYTDSVAGTSDDVLISATNMPFENILAAAVSAYVARVLRDTDPDLSAQLLTEAAEDFVAAREARSVPPMSPEPRSDPNASCWRDELAYGTLAAVELYRLTGDQHYADAAAQLGRALLDLQEQRFVDGIPITGYFYEDPQRTHIVHEFHTSFEDAAPLALQALCDTWPDHPNWIDWYAGVVLHSEFLYHQGAAVTEPYRMVPSAVWRRSEVESLIERAIAGIERAQQFMGGNFRPSSFMPSPITPEAARATALRMFDEGTHLHPDYRLRAFPMWPDHIFHGNTNIQLTVTAGLTAAMQLRNQPDLGALVARQLQWVFGGNPFAQSLMYGEGYDFQPHFVVALPDIVGAVPVGINSLHHDAPFWSTISQFTFKELWVVPAARLLQTLAIIAVPARVRGAALTRTVFHEVRTNKTVRVEQGTFDLNLPPGIYAAEYGGATQTVTVVAGGDYELDLNPAHAITIDLSATQQSTTVLLEAHVHGAGAHELELHGFNVAIDTQRCQIDLGSGGVQTLVWTCSIQEQDKPWIVVATADGNKRACHELLGPIPTLVQ